MAKGRQAANDLKWGRQGGRIVPATPPPSPLAYAAPATYAGPTAGWDDDDWFCRARLAHALAAAAAENPDQVQFGPHRVIFDHNGDPIPTGQRIIPEMNDIDREAIRRYPVPPSMFDPLPSERKP